jgi:hypothetical protein
VVIDDRLLVEELLVGIGKGEAQAYTTTYWYYRACRAAVLGAAGHLSGAFEALGAAEQGLAIQRLLELPAKIALPDPRSTVPEMVRVAGRHPCLNLLNLEAVAAGRLLEATMWLSIETSRGVLPGVLDEESVPWQRVAVLDTS